jgi:hypothetical protein
MAVLLRNSVNFYTFGEPPSFKKLVKVLDFLSYAAAVYCILGMVVYNAVRLYQKAECQNQNSVESLREGCGIIVPQALWLWIPFKVDYFPIYEFVFCYTFLYTLLIKFPFLLLNIENLILQVRA